MLVIDSEARSRKFPAKPTCSIQADALKIQFTHDAEWRKTSKMAPNLRWVDAGVKRAPARFKIGHAGSNPASAITI